MTAPRNSTKNHRRESAVGIPSVSWEICCDFALNTRSSVLIAPIEINFETKTLVFGAKRSRLEINSMRIQPTCWICSVLSIWHSIWRLTIAVAKLIAHTRSATMQCDSKYQIKCTKNRSTHHKRSEFRPINESNQLRRIEQSINFVQSHHILLIVAILSAADTVTGEYAPRRIAGASLLRKIVWPNGTIYISSPVNWMQCGVRFSQHTRMQRKWEDLLLFFFLLLCKSDT